MPSTALNLRIFALVVPSSSAVSRARQPLAALAVLRAATEPDHRTVDAAFSRFDLADPRDYSGFLTAHARSLPPIEAALANVAGLPALRPRTPLLDADLAALGTRWPDSLSIAPPCDRAEAFGLAYVIEGSRLGGGILARRVPEQLSRRYLLATHLPGEWRAFGQALDAAAEDEAWIGRAAAAAKRAFALYAAAAT